MIPRWRREAGAKLVAGPALALAIGGPYFLIQHLQAGRSLPLDPWAIDAWIPFLPGTAWIYQSLYPLMLAAIWSAPARPALRRYLGSSLAATAICCLVFALWPRSVPRPEALDPGLAYRVTVWLDGPGNALPSLHVALAWIAAAALAATASGGRDRIWRRLAPAWALAVSVATLTTRQHLVQDLLAGGAVAALVVTWRYPELLLRHRGDRASLAALAVALVAPALLLALRPDPRWGLLATPLLGLVAFRACLVNHNHQHRPLARSAWANRAIDLALGAGTGVPARAIRRMHNGNHHRHQAGPDDPLHPGHVAHLPQRLRPLCFALAVMPRYRRVRRSELRRGDTDPTGAVVLLALAAAALWFDPVAGLAYLVLPWLIGQWLLITVNYLQHVGCDHASTHAHSRSVTGRTLNALCFNAGYHAAHHHRPAAHWSRLPAIHRELAPDLDPRLVHPTLTHLLRRTCGATAEAPCAPTSPSATPR